MPLCQPNGIFALATTKLQYDRVFVPKEFIPFSLKVKSTIQLFKATLEQEFEGFVFLKSTDLILTHDIDVEMMVKSIKRVYLILSSQAEEFSLARILSRIAMASFLLSDPLMLTRDRPVLFFPTIDAS